MKKNKELIPILVFLAVGLTLSAFFDKAVSMSLYDPESFFAIAVEAIGYWPLYLPVAIMFGAYAKSKRLYKKILGTVLSCITLIALCAFGVHYAEKRGVHAVVAIAPAVLFAVLLFVLIYKASMPTVKKLWFLGVVGSAYMIINNIVINVIKALWQRPRFDDMLAAGSLDAFEPWYNILGPGGSSFPSGHTGAAAGIFLLLCLCSLFEYWHKKYALMSIICWTYVGLVGAGRIIIGRHFLSDTVAASVIAFMIFYVICRSKIYQKALAATLRADSL